LKDGWFLATNKGIYKALRALKAHDAIKPPNHDERDDVVFYKDMDCYHKKRCFVDPLSCQLWGTWLKIVARNRVLDVIA
jgi:hypothetical protein